MTDNTAVADGTEGSDGTAADSASAAGPLLSVEDLVVEYATAQGPFKAVDRVDFQVPRGVHSPWWASRVAASRHSPGPSSGCSSR